MECDGKVGIGASGRNTRASADASLLFEVHNDFPAEVAQWPKAEDLLVQRAESLPQGPRFEFRVPLHARQLCQPLKHVEQMALFQLHLRESPAEPADFLLGQVRVARIRMLRGKPASKIDQRIVPEGFVKNRSAA
jgi:hypothetical protein